ncbi:MAG TPA: MFS transporter [Acetobacteraceae bacterium]|nr:MFS transporter [Acetobacteraceae bacterium]
MAGLRGWIILAAIALARIGFGYQFQTVASLGPVLMRRFGLDYAGLGTLIGLYMAAGVVIALPLGLLARQVGDRLVLGGGLALMALGGFVPALGGVEGIAAGRVLAGIGAVAMTVLQSKVIADWFPGRRFMLAVSVSVGAYPVGIGLSQLTAPPLASAYGWPAAFLAGGAEMAAAMGLFLASFRPAPAAPAARGGFHLPGRRECWLLIAAGLIWTAYTAGYAGFLSYAPSLMAVRGEGLVITGVVMALATWGNVAGTLAGGALAGRYGGWPVFAAGTVIMTVGIAAMGVVDWPIALGAIIGIPGSIQPGVIVAVGTLSARPENRAAGMGIFYTTYYAGGAVVPALCGRAADAWGGPAGAMYAAALVSALALPIYVLHRRLAAGVDA